MTSMPVPSSLDVEALAREWQRAQAVYAMASAQALLLNTNAMLPEDVEAIGRHVHQLHVAAHEAGEVFLGAVKYLASSPARPASRQKTPPARSKPARRKTPAARTGPKPETA